MLLMLSKTNVMLLQHSLKFPLSHSSGHILYSIFVILSCNVRTTLDSLVLSEVNCTSLCQEGNPGWIHSPGGQAVLACQPSLRVSARVGAGLIYRWGV